jgi:hypothetical protein
MRQMMLSGVPIRGHVIPLVLVWVVRITLCEPVLVM